MRWFKPNLRGSIYALFSSSFPSGHVEEPGDIGMEDIRDSMLALLAEAGEERAPHVTRRIRYAPDVQGLWYLRGDLMAVLASVDGEAVAREKIVALSRLFEGVLPQGLRSRPSPLSGAGHG
jgi:hypothetical protein